MFSPQNVPSSASVLTHRHSFGGGEQIGWLPANHHHHPQHHQSPGGAVKLELQPPHHQHHPSVHQINHHQQTPQQSLHLDPLGVPSTNQQQFGMMHNQPVHHTYPHPTSHGRASAPALPVFSSTAAAVHSAQQPHHGSHHTGSIGMGGSGPVAVGGGLSASLPHAAAHPHQPGTAPPAGPDLAGDSRDQRRATLPLAHADLELELQIRHNMLIEQQHRIAQLEEELNRSRAEIERLNSKVRLYEQEKAKGAQKKAQSRYWTPEEHQRFLEGVEKYGPKDVKSIALHVGTRNATQVRTHAQKYYLRIDREKKRKEERESKEKEERGAAKDEQGEDGLDDVSNNNSNNSKDGEAKDEAKAKTSSPGGHECKKRFSEPSPVLYKAAVLALLTDWVEEDYDTFVIGLQTFDSELNVQKRLQLIQEKYLPHKTLDELNAINEAIEQQANATRRKRVRLDEDPISAADDDHDVLPTDMMAFHRDDSRDSFSSSGDGFTAPYSSGECGTRYALGRMPTSAGVAPSSSSSSSSPSSLNYGRRSSLPAFPVSHSLLSHHLHHQRHQPHHHLHHLQQQQQPLRSQQQHYHHQHQGHHQDLARQQPQHSHQHQHSEHAVYSPPSAIPGLPQQQQQQQQQPQAPVPLSSSDDSVFSSFSQIIHHPPATFTAPLSPVPSPSQSQRRRMSAPNIHLEAEYAKQQQQAALMRPRYSIQFDATTSVPHPMESSSSVSSSSSHPSLQHAAMPPPAQVERRASLPSDQSEFHAQQVDYQQQQQQHYAPPHQLRRSVDFHQPGQMGHPALVNTEDASGGETGQASLQQRRHSLELHYQHPLHDNADSSSTTMHGQQSGTHLEPHHDPMAAHHRPHHQQPADDAFVGRSGHLPEGETLLRGQGQRQSTDGDASFGEEGGLPHVWSSRILGMSMSDGEQTMPASSDDFSETDPSSGSSSSTDAFGLLSAS